jgi:hypothetical protein
LAKENLNKEATARSDAFDRKIAQIIKPASLSSDAPGHNDRGTGVEIWEMTCAAITGDLYTIRKMVEGNPDLAICNYY